jgi:hypothetical protein
MNNVLIIFPEFYYYNNANIINIDSIN